MWVTHFRPAPFLLHLIAFLQMTPTLSTYLAGRHQEDLFSSSERSSPQNRDPFDPFWSPKDNTDIPLDGTLSSRPFQPHLLQRYLAEIRNDSTVSASNSRILARNQLPPSSKEREIENYPIQESSFQSSIGRVVASSLDLEIETPPPPLGFPTREGHVQQPEGGVRFYKEQIVFSHPPPAVSGKTEPDIFIGQEVGRKPFVGQPQFSDWKKNKTPSSSVPSRLASAFDSSNVTTDSGVFLPITAHPQWNVSSQNNIISFISPPFRLLPSQKSLQEKRIEQKRSPQQPSIHGSGPVGSHRGTRSVGKGCHSQHLQRCGTNVIQEFRLGVASPTSKCKIREEFLDCMVRQRKEGCSPTEALTTSSPSSDSIRTEVKNLLWSANGCLLF